MSPCLPACSAWCAATSAAGVIFTLDTESGFRDVVFVTASYGLGETVVQGAVNPDEFYVHKPKLAEGALPSSAAIWVRN
jgi:pyruvate,water dikinase